MDHKESGKLKLSRRAITEPHNLLLILVFLIQIFLLIINPFSIEFLFIALFIHIFIYILTIGYARKLLKNIKEKLKGHENISEYLLEFKKKFTYSVLGESIVFVFLILFSPNLQALFTFNSIGILYLNNFLLTFIVFTFTIKIIGDVITYFKFQEGEIRGAKINVNESSKKYRKYNAFFSIIFISLVFFYSFLLNFLIFGLIIMFLLFLTVNWEKNQHFLEDKIAQYVFLINSIGFLGIICFGLLPILISNLIWNISAIVFLVSLYLTLEVFNRLKIFKKDDTLIFQNIIGVLAFSFFIYLFYPFIFISYIEFTNNPLLILISTISLHGLIISTISLASFYILFVRHLQNRKNGLFKIAIISNFILIEFFALLILNLRYYFLNPGTFLVFLSFSNFIFSLLFLGYLGLNRYFGIFLPAESKIISFYLLWYSIPSLFFTILFIDFFNIFSLLIALLCFTLTIQLNIYFGTQLGRIQSNTYNKIKNYNSYVGLGEFFLLSLLFFSILLNLDLLFSVYLSLVISAVLFNILSYNDRIFSQKSSQIINIGSLFFTVGLIFYYTSLFTLGTYYIIVFPFIFSLASINIPLYYLKRKSIVKIASKLPFIVNNVVLGVFLSLIPTTVALEYLKLGLKLNIFHIFNATIIIVYLLFSIAYIVRDTLQLSKKYLNFLLKSQVFIEIIAAMTIVFYYPCFLLSETNLFIIVPLSLTLLFMYIPLAHSYLKELFNIKKIRMAILINSILLTLIGLFYPFSFGIEISGSISNLNFGLILAISSFILLIFLKLIEQGSEFFEFKIGTSVSIRYIEIGIWIVFSFLISFNLFPQVSIASPINLRILEYSTSFLIFFLLNLYNLIQIRNLKKLKGLQEDKDKSKPSIPKMLISYQLIIVYGLLISSSVILMSLVSFLISLEILSFWSQNVNFVIISIIIFSILSPIGNYFLKKFSILTKNKRLVLKNVFISLFVVGFLFLYIQIYWIQTVQYSILKGNLAFSILYFLAQIFILFQTFSYNRITLFSTDSLGSVYKFFTLYFSLFLIFIYFNPLISLLLNIVVYLMILSDRGVFLEKRILLYTSLIIIALIQYIALFDPFISPIILGEYPLIFYILLILASIIQVIGFSILINLSGQNRLENFIFITTLSLGTFGIIFNYTNILLLYNITIALFVFFVLSGLQFRIAGDNRYKKFIKPGIIIFIFNLVSYISYSYLFVIPLFELYENWLTLSFTSSIVGFSIILVYYDLSDLMRKRLFYPIFLLIMISFPAFFFLILVSIFPFSFSNPIPYIIVLNLGIFLFYVFIALYKWEVSWVIWKIGWYAWLFLPLVNFLLIYNAFSNIDLFTTSLNLFNVFEINGSLLFSILLATLLYLPVLYSKVKQYFNQILLGIWGESLFLVYWISQNLFMNYNIYLMYLSFFLFSLILLLPLLYKLKIWTLTSFTWLILTGVNLFFFIILFDSIGITLSLNISINILLAGLFLMVYSYFPNMRSMGLMLIAAYFIVLLGIFFSIFNLFYMILSHIFLSINFSFIIVALSLYSSRYLKINKTIVNHVFSWILISNLAWLFYNSFSLIPGIEFQIMGIFFAVMAFGGSFLVFDHFKFTKSPNKGIPLLVFAIGTSFALSWLLFVFLNISLLIFIGVLIGIMSLFLYYLLEDYNYILWFIFPIPLALILLDVLLVFDVIQRLYLLVWPIIYLLIFQVITNFSKNKFFRKGVNSENPLFSLFSSKKQLKFSNFACFIINSVYISLFITLITPFLFFSLSTSSLQLFFLALEFMIFASVLIVLSVIYLRRSELELETQNLIIDPKNILEILLLIPYLGSSLYIFLFLFEFTSLNFLGSSLIAITVLFLISTIEIYYVKIVSQRFFSLIHLCSYFLLSITFLLNILTFFEILEIIWLSISLFIGMQLYTNYFIFKSLNLYFKSNKNLLKDLKSNIQDSLLSLVFAILSIFGATLITNFVSTLINTLHIFNLYFLSISFFSVFMVLTNRFINPVSKTKIKRIIVTFSYLVFQLSFGGFWVGLIINYQLDIIFWSALLIILETVQLFYLTALFNDFKSFHKILRKYQLNAILINILYFEIAFFVFALTNLRFSIFLSLTFAALTIFVLSFLDIYKINSMNQKFGYISHSLSFLALSILLFFTLISLLEITPISIAFAFLIFTLMQFYTNYSYYKTKGILKNRQMDDLHRAKISRENILGILFYGILIFLIYLGIETLTLNLRFLVLFSVIFGLMYVDQFVFNFLKKQAIYIKIISFSALTYFTLSFLTSIYVKFLPFSSITMIPLISFILVLASAYILKNIYSVSSKPSPNSLDKTLRIWWALFYLNLISWPLFFIVFDILIIYILILSSFSIFYGLTHLDRKIEVFSKDFRTKLQKVSFLAIGGLISAICYEVLLIISLTQVTFNLSFSSFIFFFFLGYIIKPFKEHSLLSFFYWVGMFSLLSYIFYSFYSSGPLSIAIFALTLLLYPFLFLLEELKELFGKLLTFISHIYTNIKIQLTKVIVTIIGFLKENYKTIWILVSLSFSFLIFVLLIPYFSSILNITFIAAAAFGLLYSILPAKKSSNPDIRFKGKMIRLVIVWASLLGILFSFIPIEFLILSVFIGILILGAILLPYIYHKEKKDDISIKWRFYTLLSLISVLIIFGVLLYFQISGSIF